MERVVDAGEHVDELVDDLADTSLVALLMAFANKSAEVERYNHGHERVKNRV